MKLKNCDINIIATNIKLKIKSIVIVGNECIDLYDSRVIHESNLIYKLRVNNLHIMDNCTLELDDGEKKYIHDFIFNTMKNNIVELNK